MDGATSAAAVERAVLRAAGERADGLLRGHPLRGKERGCTCGASERPHSQPPGLKLCRDQPHDLTRSTLASAAAAAAAAAAGLRLACRRALCRTLCIVRIVLLGLAQHDRCGGEQRATLLQHSKDSLSR